jgi:hypothetical protein
VPIRGSRRSVPGGYCAVQLLNDIRAGRQVPEQMTIAVLVVTAVASMTQRSVSP